MLNGVSSGPSWVDAIDAPGGAIQGTLDVPITSAMCDEAGLLRLDSLARLCEMISVASGESGLRGPTRSWVVRTTSAHVLTPPCVGEWVRISISTSGWGPAWIERRITLDTVPGPGPVTDGIADTASRTSIVVSTVWVSFDRIARRPSRLDREELAHWRGAANGRRTGAAHLLEPIDSSPPPRSHPWSIRHSDIDLQGHMNNAAALTPFGEVLAGEGIAGRPGWYRVEYRSEVDRSDNVAVEWAAAVDRLDCQLVVSGGSAGPAVLFVAIPA